jgi:hypothetical protein
MQRPQHGAEVLDALDTPADPLLAAADAGDVHAVRPADVDRPVPVEVTERRAVGRGHHGAQVEPLAHDASERGRHPDRVGEPEIRGGAAPSRRAHLTAMRAARADA